MDCYELTFTVPSPANSVAFMEFSPNGRFIAIGDRDLRSLYILDRLAGLHPIISAATPTEPTALVWRNSKELYVGLNDGRFIHYRMDLRGNRLVKGATNNTFYGGLPATAIALDAESRTLILSVGPEVFAFRRIWATTEFCLAGNISSRFNFKRDPGNPPPFPRSICFTPAGTVIVAFCHQNIASIKLEFDGNSRLCSSFQTTKIDCSGLALLKAITSANDEEIHRLARFWVYSDEPQADGDEFPFLFINGGAATLSGSTLGAAIVRDTVTRRKIQILEHTAGRRVSTMAYHVSNSKYNIATVDRGTNATIKVWTAQRPSSHPQSRSQHVCTLRIGRVVVTLAITFILAYLCKTWSLPDVDEISQVCVESALMFMRVCLKTGHLAPDAVEDAVPDAEGALD